MWKDSFYREQLTEEDLDFKVENIGFLYQLRHASNVLGYSHVANKLKVQIQRVIQLCESDCHGSNEIRSWLNSKDEKFNEKLKKLEHEEHIKTAQIEMRLIDQQELVDKLKVKRKVFAKIGTNKAKRRLNKLAKSNDVAKSLRIALEVEDKNILAKDSYGDYREKIYNQKEKLILELKNIFSKNNWIYGVQISDVPGVSHVVYFEIPGCEQISWHLSLNKKHGFPTYSKEWDGKHQSTLDKIENTVYHILKENGLITKKDFEKENKLKYICNNANN